MPFLTHEILRFAYRYIFFVHFFLCFSCVVVAWCDSGLLMTVCVLYTVMGFRLY